MIPLAWFLAGILAYIAVMLTLAWWELRRARRPQYPAPSTGRSVEMPAGDGVMGDPDTALLARQKASVREKVRKHYPKLTSSAVDKVVDEIIEKARATLGRIK